MPSKKKKKKNSDWGSQETRKFPILNLFSDFLRDTLDILPAFYLTYVLLALLIDLIGYGVRKIYFYLIKLEIYTILMFK